MEDYMKIENRLHELGLNLPSPPIPVASYVPCVQVGNLVFLSGQGTVFNGERLFEGKVGEARTLEEGREAAKICGLNLLAQLKHFLGDLDRITKIVNIRGYIASHHTFYGQPKVLDGLSNLLIELFGDEIGKHSRCALGTNVLPNNITVEVEMLVQVQE